MDGKGVPPPLQKKGEWWQGPDRTTSKPAGDQCGVRVEWGEWVEIETKTKRMHQRCCWWQPCRGGSVVFDRVPRVQWSSWVVPWYPLYRRRTEQTVSTWRAWVPFSKSWRRTSNHSILPSLLQPAHRRTGPTFCLLLRGLRSVCLSWRRPVLVAYHWVE